MTVKVRLSKAQQQAVRQIAAGGWEWKMRYPSAWNKSLHHPASGRWLRQDVSAAIHDKGLSEGGPRDQATPAVLTELGARWADERPEEAQ